MAEETTITDGGSSPSPQAQPFVKAPVFLDEPAPAPAEPTKPDATPDGAAEKKKDLESRYDKDPEFKKAVDEKRAKQQEAEEATRKFNEFKTSNEQTIKQLMEKIGALEGKLTPKQEEKLDFKPIQNMTPEELRDWREEDPIGYEQNRLKQFMHEVTQRLPKYDKKEMVTEILKELTQMGKQYETKKTQETTAQATREDIEAFAKKHPDMEELVPQILEVRKQKPWRDAISIYWELKGTGPDVQEQIDAAVEKAKQEWLQAGADKVKPTLKPGSGGQRSSPNEFKRLPNETDTAFVARKVAAEMAKVKG